MPYHLAMAPYQTYGAQGRNRTNDTRIFSPLLYHLSYLGTVKEKWSGQRGSNSLPPPWQGGALPDELCPHIMATEKGLEPSTSGVTGRRSNRLNYSATLRFNGGSNRTRTCDPLLVRQVL